MNAITKILIAEHDKHDLEIIDFELKMSGLDYVTENVENEVDYRKSLKNFIPDVILCDYTFPSFDGPTAFRIREEIAPETPFILVSGSIGEEKSIELIKNGVTDFVLKEKLFTLNTKLLRALKEAKDQKEKSKTEQDLKRTAAHLVEAQNLAKMGSWDFNFADDKLIWSEQLYKVFDTDKQTFAETHGSFLHLIDEADRSNAEQTSKRTQETGEEFEIEYRITTNKGEKRVIQEHGFGVKDADGKVIRLFGTAQDISERKESERLIQESEAKYRSFFESSMDGILLTVTDGEILSANPAACDIFKMTEEEICAAGRLGVVDLSDPRVKQLIEERQRTGRAKGELTMLRKDGSKFQAELTSAVFTDSYGRERTSMIVRDVSHRKNLEKALQAEQKRFAGLYLQAPSCMGILKGPNHVFETANPLYLQLIGKTDIIGKTVKEVLPEMEDQGILEILDNVYKTGETFLANEMLLQIDALGTGNLIDSYLNFMYQAHRDDQNEIDGILFLAIDVTEQVLSRKKIEESNKEFQFVTDFMPQLLWVTKPDGYHDYYNKQWYDYTGLSPHETEGEGWNLVFHPDDQDRAWGLWRHSLETGTPMRLNIVAGDMTVSIDGFLVEHCH